ncbi:MAG: DUF6062 family protein [Eubacteriales bacterium]|nr:DUF6062 family protein [Eubacteriales bacterium]
MQYHLDTIPVWEALEKQGECPMCYIRRKVEQDEVERSLGGSVMEPDARIRVNERGICAEHNRQLAQLQNKLGHALLIDSHTRELLKRLEKTAVPAAKGGFSLGRRSGSLDPLIEELESMASRCVLCEAIEQHMQRYEYTFLHLWKNDAKFRETWEHSKGVCVPHAVRLLKASQKHLNEARQIEFASSLLERLRAELSQNEKDLEWFTLKFDYRNQDKPWGNSRTALERTVNRLRGYCLGDDPLE